MDGDQISRRNFDHMDGPALAGRTLIELTNLLAWAPARLFDAAAAVAGRPIHLREDGQWTLEP